MSEVKRCAWAQNNELEKEYHDCEWGVVETNEQKMFEMLMLEGQQAGLSWITVLKKREGYRELFANFAFYDIARYTSEDIDRILDDSRIIRHRKKLEAIVHNAQVMVQMHQHNETLSALCWSKVNNKPIINDVVSAKDVPAQTDLSRQISKELKAKGFKFVGPTTVYAFMQAIGMVNDHENDCFCKNNR